jgi:(E)-4-hydroxy-3-methylbut-2-enyl-diphosphate synthase
VESVVAEILELEQVGCDIIRVGFLDIESVKNISEIKKHIHIPLVADIHFNYQLALEAIAQGADKLRINPGNIGTHDQVKMIVKAAKEKNVPIRIGVNGGSLQKDLLAKHGGHPTAAAMVASAAEHIKILEDLDFKQIAVSLKASDVLLTMQACELFSERYDYPLHLGVTEAGTKTSSTVKSSIGIGSLLLKGIGDTIRVSMTDSNIEEVKVGKEILSSLGLRSSEPTLISCPMCSRTCWDMLPITKQVDAYLQTVKKPIKVAVMGCAVNGPGEASEADIGVAGGKDRAVLFACGQVVKDIAIDDILPELKAMVENF